MKRNAYRIDKAGSISRLKNVTEALPEPADDEVTVRVKAIGLNFADLFAIKGLYSATPKQSFVPGLEYAGIIHAKGKNVNEFDVGQSVAGVIRFGAYTDFLNINKNYIIPLPETWTFEEGAAFIVQSLTAYYALFELGNLKPGDTVLIHSAAGGVGLYANRIAKKFDAFIIGTVGSNRKVELLKREGYDQVIIRDKEFGKKLSAALTNRKLNIVLECIGGKIFKESFRSLSPSGRIIVYGAAQFSNRGKRPNYLKILLKYLSRPKVDPLSLSDKNRGVLGFNLIYLWENHELMKELLQKILSLNLPKPLLGQVYNYSELKNALAKFQSGETTGKVVVKV
ncbi:MAG: zinc-binding dehydrogenase [Ignavibacteriaceae bacterium]|nr:zinc-binding dehydrogenase [Ignavibacteriaceae bacterium]